MGDDESAVEVWTFAGERVGSDGKKRVHVWLDETGRDLWFAAKTGLVIGGRYRVRVKRSGEDSVSLYGSPAPEYVERVDSENEQLAVWQAADIAAKTRQAARRREARDAAEATNLDNAIATIRRIANRQRTAADRAALVGHVITQITSIWGSK